MTDFRHGWIQELNKIIRTTSFPHPLPLVLIFFAMTPLPSRNSPAKEQIVDGIYKLKPLTAMNKEKFEQKSQCLAL